MGGGEEETPVEVGFRPKFVLITGQVPGYEETQVRCILAAGPGLMTSALTVGSDGSHGGLDKVIGRAVLNKPMFAVASGISYAKDFAAVQGSSVNDHALASGGMNVSGYIASGDFAVGAVQILQSAPVVVVNGVVNVPNIAVNEQIAVGGDVNDLLLAGALALLIIDADSILVGVLAAVEPAVGNQRIIALQAAFNERAQVVARTRNRS